MKTITALLPVLLWLCSQPSNAQAPAPTPAAPPRLQLPGQVKITYDVCTRTYYVSAYGKVKKLSDAQVVQRYLNGLPIRRTVSLGLEGLNPTYYDQLKLSGKPVTMLTEEPNDFGWTKLPKLGNDPNNGDEQAPFRDDNQDSPQAKIQREIVALRSELDAKRGALNEANALMQAMGQFVNDVRLIRCLNVAQYDSLRGPLVERITGQFTDVLPDNATSLTFAFRKRYEDYFAAYAEAKDRLADLNRQVNALADQVNKAKTAAGKKASKEALAEQAIEELLVADLIDQLKLAEAQLARDGADVAQLQKELAGDTGRQLAQICRAFAQGKLLYQNRPGIDPLQAPEDADDLHLTAKGIRKDPNDAQKTIEESLVDLTIPVTNGLKIDFSLGGAFTTLADHSYTVRQGGLTTDPADTTFTVQANNGRGGFIVGTYAHAVWRALPGFGVGANVGVGVDFLNDQRARYMAGLSLRFGGTFDNLLINVGLVGGTVKRLSSEHNTTDHYRASVDPKTVDQFQTGWYAGISYVLGRNKKAKSTP